MRFCRGIAWIIGGLGVATAGLVAAGFLGVVGAGPGVGMAALTVGVVMADRGLSAW